ncbi:SIMPL domain-containing protein [Nanoarchaeota archaeon]
MDKAHLSMIVVLILGFAVMSFAIMKAPAPEITVTGGSGEAAEKDTISVQGYHQLEADPDEAEVYIRVTTEEPTAKTAQQANARLMNTVKAALENAGVNKADMETTNYNLWPQQKWDRDTNEYIKTGYRVQHLLKVTTDDVTEVGDLLDIAVLAGANGLDRVNFKLSDELKAEINDKALEAAAKDAKDKGESIAKSIGVKITGISKVFESNVGYDYIRPMYAMAEAAMDSKAGGTTTEISPQSVKVSATINIVYKIA